MHRAVPMHRRLVYAIAAAAIVALGLLWRSHLFPLSAFFVKYGGDALWAALVYILTRLCHPRISVIKSAIVAFMIALAVEFSQLYHAPWFDALRHTRPGALVLGSTFNWPDIPAYAVGIVIAALIDRLWQKDGARR
jgi:hypothetical protein